MPVSKNRAGHKRKVTSRNKQIKDAKNRLNNMYNQMYKELNEKNVSVPDMLNKEDIDAIPVEAEEVKDLTDEEAFEYAKRIVSNHVLENDNKYIRHTDQPGSGELLAN